MALGKTAGFNEYFIVMDSKWMRACLTLSRFSRERAYASLSARPTVPAVRFKASQSPVRSNTYVGHA